MTLSDHFEENHDGGFNGSNVTADLLNDDELIGSGPGIWPKAAPAMT